MLVMFMVNNLVNFFKQQIVLMFSCFASCFLSLAFGFFKALFLYVQEIYQSIFINFLHFIFLLETFAETDPSVEGWSSWV